MMMWPGQPYIIIYTVYGETTQNKTTSSIHDTDEKYGINKKLSEKNSEPTLALLRSCSRFHLFLHIRIT